MLLTSDQIPADLMEFFEPAGCGKCFVCRMVDVFREVRRVLRSDGTCWVNLGDSYASAWACNRRNVVGAGSLENGKREARPNRLVGELKEKDLVGIPWRLAFALQADGWYLRADIIWAKPNPMPESVTDRPTKAHEYVFLLAKSPRYFFDAEAVREEYAPKTLTHRGGGRAAGKAGNQDANGKVASGNFGEWDKPRTAHPRPTPQEETLDGSAGETPRGPDGRRNTHVEGSDGSFQHRDGERWPNPTGRNVRSVWEIEQTGRPRDVWTIATQPHPEAHFATYPEALVRRCILAGTSERGCCPVCGKPWERRIIAEAPDGRRAEMRNGKAYDEDGKPLMGDNMFDHGVRGSWNSGGEVLRRETAGWRSDCDHEAEPIPCTVLDPFLGSGTTAYVARQHGRRSIGIELNAKYCELAARRLQQQSLFAETA